MNIMVVESSSKIKTMQHILKKINPEKTYLLFASGGHIDNLPSKSLGIDIDHQFKPTYVLLPKKKQVLDKIKDCFKKYTIENIYLATDKDFEGEKISDSLIRHIPFSHFRRIYFNEITESSIRHAMKHYSTHLDKNMLQCQETRRILDRLLGYQITPILWKKFQQQNKIPLSIGRVQCAVLSLFREKQTSDPHKKWYIDAQFDNLNCHLMKEDQVWFSTEESDCRNILNKLEGRFTLLERYHKDRNVSPPLPFITSSLQQTAYSELHFPIALTMKLAQELYEKGFITYLRTDSFHYSDSFCLEMKNYIEKTIGLSYFKGYTLKKKIKNAQEAHEAIRPTDITKENVDLTPQHQKLYLLIRKRTMATFLIPAIYRDYYYKIMDGSFVSQNLYFLGKISQLLEPGFLILYGKTRDSFDEKFEMKERNIFAQEKLENAIQFYDEGSIIKKMETLGIGRPATYQSCFGKLVDKEYIKKTDIPGQTILLKKLVWQGSISEERVSVLWGHQKNKFIMTELGSNIHDFLVRYFQFITKVEYTSEMESFLDQVHEGKKQQIDVLQSFWDSFQPMLQQDFGIVIKKKAVKSLHEFKMGRKKIKILDGKFGPYLSYQDNKKTKNISLNHYLEDRHKHLREITDKDISILLSFPIKTQKNGSEYTIQYGRYGLYCVEDKFWKPSWNDLPNYE